MDQTSKTGVKGINKGIEAMDTHNLGDLRHNNLFVYIESMVEFFEEVGISFDIDLTYDIEKMYSENDYMSGTDEHKELLISLLDMAQATFDCFRTYEEIVEDLKYMIDRM